MNHLALTLPADPQRAHAMMTASAWPYIKSHTLAGTALAMVIKPQEDDRSLRQNAYMWGVVLKEISEQARVNGQKYTADAWHELGKRSHLLRKVTKKTVAGRKRKVVCVSIGSTKDLSVKAMSAYLDKLTAFAATELGVTFSVPNWQEFGSHMVDMTSGEILEAT